jgi:hypothetical protein
MIFSVTNGTERLGAHPAPARGRLIMAVGSSGGALRIESFLMSRTVQLRSATVPGAAPPLLRWGIGMAGQAHGRLATARRGWHGHHQEPQIGIGRTVLCMSTDRHLHPATESRAQAVGRVLAPRQRRASGPTIDGPRRPALTRAIVMSEATTT